MRIILFILLALAVTSGLSCKKENRCDCIKRTGDIAAEYRTLPEFNRIYAEDNVNVYITQDTVFEVKVEAGENLLPLIKTEVREGEIFLKNDNRCNWTRSYKPQINVHLKMPGVKYITSNTVGIIKSTNVITTESFDYRTISLGDIDLTVNNREVTGHMHGAGDIYIRGTTGTHACHIIGNGFVRASDLVTGYTWIYSNTTGNIYINTENLLHVSIDGSGDVIYKGEPTIEKQIKGTGRLIPE